MSAIHILFAVSMITGAPVPDNLLVNPDFDTDLVGWVDVIGALWDPEDVDGAGSSGSARVVVQQPPNSAAGLIQCVPISPGGEYAFEASGLFPSGQPMGDNFDAKVSLTFWDGPDCADGSTSGSGMSMDVPQDGLWHRLDFGTFSVPSWSPSAEIAFFAVRRDTTVEPVIHVDSFVFAGPEVIFSDTFESGGLFGWSAVIP